MTISRWKYILMLVISLLLFFAVGCIDMEIDLTIYKDSTGKAKIVVTATEPFYNGFVDEFVEDVRRVNPEARINESLRGLNKSAQIEFSFKDVDELAEYGFYINHYQDDKISSILIQEIKDLPVEVTLNMPGKIIASNGKHSGSKVTWEKGYMDESYWVESEVGGIFGATSIYLIGAIIVIIISFGGWYFFKRKNESISFESETGQNSINCGNCGLGFDAEDRYCANCGLPKGFISPTNNYRQVKHWTGISKDRPLSAYYLPIAIVALVVIAAIAIFINDYYRETTATSDAGRDQLSGNDSFNSDNSFTDDSDDWLIDEENENYDDGMSSEAASENEEIDPVEEEAEFEENGNITWAGGTYNGQLLNGIPHGYGTWHGSDGRKYYGDFVNGEMSGYGTMIFPDGETYIGDFYNGVGHGQGVMTHPDGRSISGTWVSGVYQGD